MSASLAPECNEIKEKYDSCFLKWYSEKYLRGNSSSNDCEEIFQQYKKCLSKTLREKGIDKMVEEARSSNLENDSEHVKKSCMSLPVCQPNQHLSKYGHRVNRSLWKMDKDRHPGIKATRHPASTMDECTIRG
ncbi:hypothetical protein AJ80_03124 [Polytolypa hystricis UAMH7299]|uniref:Mitochondrial distribution and morphology protein 35 n=1 Tax=Polytolypa hystricis (strain UAMH7299) TaxID=1447883 RepID=A0A2B7YBW4_POLH7|nr:hypothetical protein AJ80_03124 [Polytolypa hystricis UAMH7299]